MLTDTIYNIILKKDNKTMIINAAYSIKNAQLIVADKAKEYKSRTTQEWSIVESTEQFTRLQDKTGKTIDIEIHETHICDAGNESEKWNFDYEQEFPESKWANLIGTIRNNNGQCLFYAVSTDSKGNWTNLKLFSSIDLTEDSFLVSYPWNDFNDSLVIEALNTYPLDKIVEDEILETLPFKDNTPQTE